MAQPPVPTAAAHRMIVEGNTAYSAHQQTPTTELSSNYNVTQQLAAIRADIVRGFDELGALNSAQ